MTDNSRLQGMLRWSLAQSDGTGPARQISDEEREWFKGAIESQLVDVVGRMKEITAVMNIGEEGLLKQGVTVDELAGMLQELQEHVESLDMANDLKAIGGIDPLLKFLKSPEAILRARAAEVVATMVQNNERSQQNVMHAGGLVLLCDNYMNDTDVVAQTKALGAISSLIRHNEDGLATFRAVCGTAQLLKTLSSGDTKLQRKSLYMLKYVLDEYPSDKKVATEQGATKTVSALLFNAEADVREGAAEVLTDLGSALSPDASESKEAIAAADARLAEISRLSGEDAEDASAEKAQLVKLKDVLSSPATSSASSTRENMLALGPPR